MNVVEPGNEAVNRTFAIGNYLWGLGLWIKKFLEGITLSVPVEDLRGEFPDIPESVEDLRMNSERVVDPYEFAHETTDKLEDDVFE